MNAKRGQDVAARPWAGPLRRYDIVKEFTIALLVMSVLALALSALFSSPDDKALTFKGWATNAGDNFYATAVQELAGTSGSAGYGPPYNTAGNGLKILGFVDPAKWMGVRIPVDPVNDFVITPLKSQAQPADVAAGLQTWDGATADQQSKWATAYDTAVQATADSNGALHIDQVKTGDYGPVPVLAKGLEDMAASGALDGILMAQGGYYETDYTKQVLFLGDGSYLDDAATAAHLQGNTWGMMNETGSYPGQAWLWLYSFWYQIPFFNPSPTASSTTTFQDNADLWIFAIMMVLTAGLAFLPFIPGLNAIPRWIPIHRVIWRSYYRKHGNTGLV